ncbi:unnamed protein product [Malus baccata var. baccata]
MKSQVQKGKRKDFNIRKDGALVLENRLYVPQDNEAVKKEILDEAHISAYAMHPRSTKLYRTIHPFYYWVGMKRDVADYASRCIICQQVKAERQQPKGLMQNLPIPAWKLENITMDFVYSLMRTQSRFDDIWVIVDRLTKTAHFLPVRQTYSLEKLSKLFIDNIVRLHGVPVSIISDRDPRFELPPELSLIHNVFHVSMLRKYVSYPSHIIQLELLEVNQDASYVEEPVVILDRQDKVLRNKVIPLVKMLWRNHAVEEATWETEDLMRSQYPFLFG